VPVEVDPNTYGNQPETETYADTLNGSLNVIVHCKEKLLNGSEFP
jgi:hypothetical protein